MPVRFTEHDLERWVESGLISAGQRDSILAEIADHPSDEGLSVSNLLYLGGGLLVLVAYSIFLGFQWESLNEGGRIVISAFSLALFSVLSFVLLRTERLRLPGELLQVVAVAVVPLLAYAALDAVGLWPGEPSFRSARAEYHTDLAWARIAIAGVTLLGAVAAFRLSRSPFALAAGVVSFAWLVLDASFLLEADRSRYEWYTEQYLVLASLGALSLVAGVVTEGRSDRPYSIWLYVLGLTGMAMGLGGPVMESNSEGWALLWLFASLAVVALSIPLQQRLFAAVGFAGVFLYLARLVFEVFESAGAALALVVLGMLILAAGAVYQRFSERLYGREGSS